MTLKWFASSLLGHIVFFGLIFSLPALLYGLISNYGDRFFTPAFALEMALEVLAIGALAAAAIWYVVTLPIIRRTKK